MIQALEELEYSFETMKPGLPREKAVCPVCGAKYKWRPRGVGWGVLGGENTCSYKCQKEAVRRMEEEQRTKTEGGFIKPSAFEGHLEEIKARIAAGDTMAEIARDYDRNGATLSKWLSIQVYDLVLDGLKAQGRAARKSAKSLDAGSAPAEEAKAKNRLVFETMENPDAVVYRADQVPPELGYVPPVQVLGPESTEAAWRALGVIEGICKTQLPKDCLPPIMAAMETIAEALR